MGKSKTDNTKEYSNLLEQNFFAEKPSEKCVGDITNVYTKETGWTYLAIVMDLFVIKMQINIFSEIYINRRIDISTFIV